MRTFNLPDLGEGLTEAEIVAVLVHEGDVIREDAPLLEVETDKAQVEIPSPMGGRVEKIHVEPGQTVKVGAPLVTFADVSDQPAVEIVQYAGRTTTGRPFSVTTTVREPRTAPTPEELRRFLDSIEPA